MLEGTCANKHNNLYLFALYACPESGHVTMGNPLHDFDYSFLHKGAHEDYWPTWILSMQMLGSFMYEVICHGKRCGLSTESYQVTHELMDKARHMDQKPPRFSS